MTAPDPVALLVRTLAGLSTKEQATVLERVTRVYVQICHDAYPDMPPEEIARQFGAIANAARARLAEEKAARRAYLLDLLEGAREPSVRLLTAGEPTSTIDLRTKERPAA